MLIDVFEQFFEDLHYGIFSGLLILQIFITNPINEVGITFKKHANALVATCRFEQGEQLMVGGIGVIGVGHELYLGQI